MSRIRYLEVPVNTTLLSALTALAVVGTTGAVAYAGSIDAGVAPAAPRSSTLVPTAFESRSASVTPDPCEPTCIVAPLPSTPGAPGAADDDGTADQGRGDVTPTPAAPAAPAVGPDRRGDGTLEDSATVGDDDGTADQGRGDRPRADDTDDRSVRRGEDDRDHRGARGSDDDDRSGRDSGHGGSGHGGGSSDDDGTPDQGSGDR
jgi:hypothetical protein